MPPHDLPDGLCIPTDEPAAAVIATALGNAGSDATGARLRQAPFALERARVALASAT